MMLSNLNLLATAPGGVARLRELILTLAVQGKLVPQDPADEPASVLLRKIRAEKDRLIAEGKIKKDKPLAAIAEEEKPFGLPVGWEWTRVGQVSTRVQYGITASADHASTGPRFVRITDIQNDQVNWETVPGVQGLAEDFSDHYLMPGDLLIARTGGTIGKSFLVPNVQGEAVFASYLIRITPIAGLEPSYLKVFASSSHYWSQLREKSMGTGQPNVNGTALSLLSLPLPPLAEQSRIVARVEELMRLCDALQAKGQLEATQHAQLLSTLLGTLTASATPDELANNWQRVAQHFDLLLDRPQAIDALEQTLLQLAVRGLLVPQDPSDEPAFSYLSGLHASVPDQSARDTKHVKFQRDDENLQKGWCWTSIAGIAECLDYMRKPVKKDNRGTYNAGVPYYGANGQVGWIDDFIFDEDLVLVVEDETFIGRTKPFSYVIRGRSWVNNHAHVLRPREGMNLDYLNMCLERYDFVPLTSGTTNRRKLTKAGLLDAQVMLPPLAEQSRIVTRVTQLRRLCFELRQRLAEREAVQARLAEALVQQVA